jgi:ATP-dependent exoDNAse (exonuclease V) alpha subunit
MISAIISSYRRLHSKQSYKLRRKQFPLAPSYATTFNSCQGMTVDVLGVDISVLVLTHGQLYTALSRVRNCNYITICLKEGLSSTKNVTYN